MATSVWQGHLSFGMVTVPIRLHSGPRQKTASMNQVHDHCGSRLRQLMWCTECEQSVAPANIVKGTEVDGKWVVVTPAEIAAVNVPSSKVITVLEFVAASEVDPAWFEQGYWLAPAADGGGKAFALLAQAMQRTGTLGICQWASRSREHLAVIRPAASGLMLHTLFFADEMRVELPDLPAVTEEEVAMGTALVEAFRARFEPDKYHDRYREALGAMLQAKADGVEPPAPEAAVEHPDNVVDLMAMLKASLAKRGAA